MSLRKIAADEGPSTDLSAGTGVRRMLGSAGEKGLIQGRQFSKVSVSNSPRFKVQSPGGREGELPAEGVVPELEMK
jgi:hypothetical protein